MTLAEFFGLLAVACAGWFVWDSLRVREAANAAMRAACDARGLYFLDDTVALKSLRPTRNDEGHVVLRRVYGFEYSDTGHNRRKGSITMIASVVAGLDLGLRLVAGGEAMH